MTVGGGGGGREKQLGEAVQAIMCELEAAVLIHVSDYHIQVR